MRILLTLLTAICFTTIACGEATKAKRRERGGLSQTDYDNLIALNGLLTDNEDAIQEAISPNAMISEKASRMAAKLESGGCRAVRNEHPPKSFSASWKAVQQVEGPDTCPIFSARSWEFRMRPESRELWMTHVFTTKDAHKDFLKQTGIKNLSASTGRIWVSRDGATGATRIQGGITYDTFVLANGARLRALVQTNQAYNGNSGRGSITVTIMQPGGFSHTGGVTWDARDFSSRRYYAENGDIDHESFQKLFSFFRVDEIIENSEGMR